ncbi:ABC transporter permease [Rhodobacteraceae bacterium DSL-40]|uniref:ABC transporter permease n=1 Tax=Amaricoccus sp. B4 TaxID=3368557 RepID=UPI000DADDB78
MLGRLFAMIVKELLAILRDPRARIILIVPPTVQLVVLGLATTLEVKNVDIGIFDRDGGAWSREFSERLAGSPNFREIRPIHSAGAMRRAIDNQEVLAVVVFGQGFSGDIAAGRPAEVQLILDGRRSNAAQIVSGYIFAIAEGLSGELGSGTGLTSSITTHWFNPNLDYLWFTMPGLLVVITTVLGLGLTAQTVARERELGTFDQLMVSPLRVPEILVGKMVPPVLVGFFDATLYVIIIPAIFGVPLRGSVPLLYLSLLFYLLALVGVGMLVSSIAQTQQQAFLGMFLVAVPAILLSGYASPVDNMPGWLQIVAQGNPSKHFLVVSEGIFLKAMPPGDVLANTWPLGLIAVVTLAASAILFRARME